MPRSLILVGLGILGKILGSLRHPRSTDIRVKSQRGLSGLTCIYMVFLLGTFRPLKTQHFALVTT